jgi:hypothetical protein
MGEKPKSIWKRPWLWKGWHGFFILSLIFSGVPFLTILLTGLLMRARDPAFPLATLIALLGFLVVSLFCFVRWIFCWRNFKRFLFGLACLITLIALFYVEEDWRGKHDWEKFKREWEAKGEHFDYASIIPPPVPDEQNFALVPVIASSYEMFFDKSGHEVYPRNTNVVDRLSMITWRDNHWAHIPKSDSANYDWQASKKTDLKAWQDYFRSPPPANSIETNSFPVAPQPQSPADDVLLALSKYDSAIEEIREASKLPYSRFPLTYGNGDAAAILLPHLAAVKSCAQALTLRSLAELQNGQSEKAMEDVELSLYLANSIRTEPIEISQLVRIAILQNTLQPVYEGLAEHKWPDERLAELDRQLAKLDFIADYKLIMRSELGFQGGIIEYLRRQPGQFMNLSTENYSGKTLSFLAGVVWQLIPGSFFDQNRLNCARMMVEFYIPLANINQETISPTLTRRADAAVGAATRYRNPYNMLAGILLPGFGAAGRKFAQAQTSADLARVAVALERYRLAQGEFPESLDALAPLLIAIVPHDVINGEPLHYRRTDDGQFVLYSVGLNEKDDGGVVSFRQNGSVDTDKGDWVWRYPKAE